MCKQCYIYLRLPVEVVKDREHLLFNVIIAFEARHFNNHLKRV